MAGYRLTRRFLVGGLATGTLLLPRSGLAQPAATSRATPPPDGCVPLEDGQGCLDVAPEEDRVDLGKATFKESTAVTNPLFPVSALEQVIQLGEEGGEPLRVEVTLLPDAKAIEWEGATVSCTVAQVVSYAGGEITEVALDYYAQADDGAVWYFGEDVANYEAGVIANTDGTWLAGIDGPPGMIMPAKPTPGDVYRPENIPGLVFEEVTVREQNLTVEGPTGAVTGAIRVDELLMDGSTETRVFAPGYGEFTAEAENELVQVALAVPIDTEAGWDGNPVPVQEALDAVTGAVAGGSWPDAEQGVADLAAAWAAIDGVPAVIAERMDGAIAALREATAGQDAERALGAALRGSQLGHDLQLLRDPVATVDLARIDARARHLVAHTEIDGAAGLASDVAVIDAIWQRVGIRVDAATQKRVESDIVALRSSAEQGDVRGATEAAESLREHLAGAKVGRASRRARVAG